MSTTNQVLNKKTNAPTIKKLSQSQLETFDQEYVNQECWETFQQLIQQHFPDGKFSLLDVGGGNGKFADRILANFPEAQVVLLDNSENLLQKNTEHPNKTLIYASVEDIEQSLSQQAFDIISINWVLHHLVGDTYGQSRQYVHNNLLQLQKHLKPNGYISVFENMYNGWLFTNWPSYIIFFFTTRKNKFLNKIINRMGANTVGVGVCFQSEKQWDNTFQKAGFNSIQFTHFKRWSLSFIKRLFLHLGPVRFGHYWLQKKHTHQDSNNI